MPNVLTELARHSFPKGLRFCNQCKILHTNLTVVVKRNKNKRFIPKAEIDTVVNQFEHPPYWWMKIWLLRRLLFLSPINHMRRGLTGKPLWILSYPMEAEHKKLKDWIQHYIETGAPAASETPINDPATGSRTSTANAASATASSGPNASLPSGAKKGKWSAAKYVRDTKKPSAPTSSIPTRSDKSTAGSMLDTSTRGIASDLAADANEQAAPTTVDYGNEKASVRSQSMLALRHIFGVHSPSLSVASPIEGISVATTPKSATGAGRQSQARVPTKGEWTVNGRSSKDYIEREVFEINYLNKFHVAMTYHLTFIGGMVLLCFCLFQLLFAFYVHTLYYWVLMWEGKGSTVQGLVEAHLPVEELHLTVEVPTEFKSRLPPPAVVVKASEAPKRAGASSFAGAEENSKILDPRTGKPLHLTDGNNERSSSGEAGADGESDVYVLNAVEMTSPNNRVKVLFLPTPVIGPEQFYREQGRIMGRADMLLLEGVSLVESHKQSASTFFPLHGGFFEPYGLSHRFYDVLNSDSEPPMLIPAANPSPWSRWLPLLIIPFPYVMVHAPQLLTGSKGEARIGWSWLMDTLEVANSRDTQQGPTSGQTKIEPVVSAGQMAAPRHEGFLNNDTEAVVIAVPWSVGQIANIEASLLKQGYTVSSVLPMKWMEVGQMGRAFAEYNGVKAGNNGPVTSATSN